MAYSDRTLYRPLYQKQTYSSWMFPRVIKSIAACLSFAFFIAIQFIHLNQRHVISNHSPSSWKFDESKVSIDSISNIIVVIDGDQQATSLQPIYCKLNKRNENIYTHVIVTGKGRGMGGTKLLRFNSLFQNCDVSVYDLELRKDISSNENIVSLVFHGINYALNQIRPDVLIYINEPESETVLGIEAALVATPESNSITKIVIPSKHTKNLMWITDLSIEALKNWNTPKIQLQVVTQNRPDSLARLMRSLNSSIYFGDDVQLTIHMDQGSDPVTIKYSQTFDWTFGRKNIRHRIVHGGLLSAVIESYYPSDNHDYAVILEDDVELSPFFYIWAKYCVLKYRYGTDRSLSGRMFGVSLYNTKLNELHLPGRRPFNPALALRGTIYPNQSPYLSQVPCSWGALYFPEIWREYRIYQNARLNDVNGLQLQDISVPGSRSNRWKKSWKRFFIELTYLRGYVMLYPNYEDSISFSTNHAEIGVHNHKEGKKRDVFRLPLMKEDTVLDGLPGGHLPNFKDLPTMDLWGELIPQKELIQRGRKLHLKISSCPPSGLDELTYDPQDLLCVDEEVLRIKMMKYSDSEINPDQDTSDNIKMDELIAEKENLAKNPIIKIDNQIVLSDRKENKVIFSDHQEDQVFLSDDKTNKVIPSDHKENQIIPSDDEENKVIFFERIRSSL
ncbi:12874_t:CDS:2 [Cetraspora pellucida]|uniref:12874_t:CDS:1 n=1 Tax=Cetraspora pellucida TaxID=1433469 RepID=A0A9N9BKK5_9GLOM|nr:12874_t:CDS:2 [Cetraspora pellucida]